VLDVRLIPLHHTSPVTVRPDFGVISYAMSAVDVQNYLSVDRGDAQNQLQLETASFFICGGTINNPISDSQSIIKYN